MARKLPLYRKLYADLKKAIDDGKYPLGSLLPSENELSEKYGTTRATVRHSLKELMITGYITRRHGKGSIVAEPKKGLGILSIRGVTAAVGTTTLKTKIVSSTKKMKWPSNFFFNLSESDLEQGCLYFTRIRYVNNVPVLFEETFLTDKSLPSFVSIDLENKSLFSILKEKYKIEIKSGEQKIWAVQASDAISRLLKIKAGSPVLQMQRKLITDNDAVCLFSSLYCNTMEFYLHDYF